MSDQWCTPPLIVERVHRVRPIALDPCGSLDGSVGATRTILPPDDGLSISWEGFTFVNPPYSRITPWVAHGLTFVDADVLYLLPESTANWFHLLQRPLGSVTCFLYQRLAFLRGGVPQANNPKGSMLVLLSRDFGLHDRFRSVFRDLGTIMVPES